MTVTDYSNIVLSSPSQFKGLMDDFNEQHRVAVKLVGEMEELMVTFNKDHEGPDIDTIIAGGSVVMASMEERVACFVDVASTFEKVWDALVDLEEAAEILRNKVNAHRADPDTEFVFHEPDPFADELAGLRESEERTLR